MWACVSFGGMFYSLHSLSLLFLPVPLWLWNVRYGVAWHGMAWHGIKAHLSWVDSVIS